MMRMSILKKSLRFFVAAILVAAFAFTVTACRKEDKTATYAVTFVTGGGTQIAPQYVREGETATRPEDPVRDGFVFVNWYADDACETLYDFALPVTKMTSVYAKWTIDSGTEPIPDDKKITLTLDYGYDGKTEQIKILKGSTIPFDKQKPERAEFYFGGWFKDKACTVMANLTESINADSTLYAKWVKDPVQDPDGTGIDFSKEWNGIGSTGGEDGFTFDKTVSIGSVTVDPDIPETPQTNGTYTVAFNSNGGTDVSAQSVTANCKASAPNAPEREGYMFCGWYKESSLNTLYDFNQTVATNLTLHAKWAQVDSKIKKVKGYNESLAVVFSENNPAGASVQYALKGTSDWKSVDSPLIRNDGNGTARVDVVGLAAGEYNVKIKTSANAEITLPEAIKVTAYDRSGYAHFNYNEGVGAYNSDGTVKDGAIIIYVTDANKNTVMRDAVAQYEFLDMFKVPNYGGGKNWNGKDAESIGWWLNNSQYGMNNLASSSNKRPSNTYVENAAERAKLGFNTANDTHPIVIRFLGTVTVPEGCTAYNSEDEGGSVGDNGNMARMKNFKNVTLEGIGEDATIKGWGFHFMSGTDQKNGQGKNFEVRNLTFTEYTEDAIGMEGQATSTKITGPVERCWVHNNVFLPGRCDNPAESDKKEGDGSCDFKRGQYFTLSYNYFEYCHKTNLVGSSDSSLQYNISMHHNMWYQCGSRIPLLRQSNLHFYNNYILGDQTETTTPYPHIAKPALSYVHSLRAKSLMFSESNYYDGCKNIAKNEGGGALGLAWNNVYNSSLGLKNLTELTSRSQIVEQDSDNHCSYQGTDYTGFWANERLFYYDKTNDRSDCLLDDAIGARTRVLQSAGVLGFGKSDVSMNMYEPSKAVIAGTTVNASALNSEGEVNGVLFKGFKSGKGKGQIVTFKITAPMEVTVTGAGGKDAESYPQLLDSYGRIWIEKFSGTRTVVLPAGTYFIATGQKDKESTLGTISFADTAASSEARINAAKTALEAIPEQIGTASYPVIKAAKDAYNALMSDEKSKISDELVSRLKKAEAAYDELTVERVIARIDYIGAVNENSYNKIIAARNEYNELLADKQALVTNHIKLVEAENAFAQYAAKNVTDRINDLPDLSKATISTADTLSRVENWFNAVDNAYSELTEAQQAQVQNYAKVGEGYVKLAEFANMINFKAALEAIDLQNLNLGDGAALKKMYTSLTETQKSLLTFAEKEKYQSAEAIYAELASQSKLITFNNGKAETLDGDSYWTVAGKFKTDLSVSINGTVFTSGLKLDSSGSLEFTTASRQTVKIYYSRKARIKVDGADVSGTEENGYYVATLTLDAGKHSITKGKDGENYLHMVEITPQK